MPNNNNKVFTEEEEKVEIEAPPEESFPASSSSTNAGLGRSTAKSSARGKNQQGKSMPKKNYTALLQAKEAAMVRDLENGSKLLNRRPPAREQGAKPAGFGPIPSKECSVSFEYFHSNEMKDLQHVFHVLNIRKSAAVDLVEHNINSVQSLINTTAAELRDFSRVGARLTLGTVGDTVASRSAIVFSRDDIEHIDILKKWYKWKMYQNENCITWSNEFTRAAVDEFRFDSMLTDELTHAFKELGIIKQVQAYLRDQGVTNVARLVAKTRQEYESLMRHQQKSTDGTALSHRLTISDVKMIEHFKSWYSYEFVGRSLPLEWVESYDKYSKRPPSQSELDLRHVLDVLGVGPDGIEFLVKTEDIRTISMLISAAKDWLKDVDFNDEELWDRSQLTHKDAKQIVKFMRWYNFYVKGKHIVPKWTQDFTRMHFAEFDQFHLQPREDMSKVQRLIRSEEPTQKLFGKSQLKITAKEEKHFKEHLDNIAEKGNITPTQRYQLQKYYKKKEMIDMVQGVKYNIEHGNEDTKLDEQLAMFLREDASEEERKSGEDLMDSKQFCKWLFGAILVIVLLTLWFYTTVYFMKQTARLNCTAVKSSNSTEDAVKSSNSTEDEFDFDDFEQCQEVFGGYTTFIHNIVFGLVTAVVIQQLGDNSDSKSSLYARFLPIYQRQVKKVNEMTYERGVVSWSIFSLAILQLKRISMAIVLFSTRIYILSWIGLGASSLIFGFVQNTSPANPIFTTGQAWLGISITSAYSFFGLNEQQQQQGGSENGNDGSRGSNVMRADSGRRESAEPTQ